MVVEQAGVADVGREDLHGFVAADLLDLPNVGAVAGGLGDEAGAEAVAGVTGRVEPGAEGAGFDDAGDGVVGEAGVADAAAFSRTGGRAGPR